MPQLGNIAYAAFVEQVGDECAREALADPDVRSSIDADRQRQAMSVLDQALMLDQS